MKVLHIPNYIYPHIGGIEQTARDILNSLSDREDIEQKVICFNTKLATKRDSVDGVEVVRCGTVAKVMSQSISLSYRRQLNNLVKNFQPNIIIFHYPNPLVGRILLSVLKKYPKIKLITWWHLDIIKQAKIAKFFDKQDKKLLELSTRVIATSANYIEGSKHLSSCKEKCTVIPSCVYGERFKPTEKSEEKRLKILSENTGKTILFAIGRHIEYKGYKYLIEASELLSDDVIIYIGGEGKLTKQLKAMAKGDRKVVFLGRLSDDDLRAYMSACDIYCFPSITKNEAFGLALAEAQLCGKPAVTFTIDFSGVNFVCLNEQTGIEVENSNPAAYAQAIEKLCKDTELRKQLGEAAQKRAEKLFSFNTFKKSVAELIDFVGEDGN